MTISVVLRLIESALAAARVAGEAEIVRTGERVVVHDEQELLQFLRRGEARPANATVPDEDDGNDLAD
jgi:hypothetical protein